MSGKTRWGIFVLIVVLFFSSCRKKEQTEVFYYKTNTFIRNWLLAGPFPNCTGCSKTNFHHGKNCRGFYTDFLKPAGGETKTVPYDGLKIPFPETVKELSWFSIQSTTDKIPLNDILSPNDMVVAYAFCKVMSPGRIKTILSVGSNDGIKVFLNGEKIHENHPRMGRWLQPDNDFIPVELEKGHNNLMLKIDEGTGDFGFIVRFLDYDSTLASMTKNIARYSALKTFFYHDTLTARFGEPYKISLLNPEEKVRLKLFHEKTGKIAEKKVLPGEEAAFALQGQPDGFITAKATFRLANDTVITGVSHQHKGKLKRHTPTTIPGNNLIPYVNGKPIFPVGTYGAPPEDYGKLKKAGYNFVITSADNLDNLQEADLMGVITVDMNDIRGFIKKYKDHPALLGWMMFDEPGYNKADILEIYNLYQTLYKLDPVHLSYMVITDPKVYTTFGRCCDVLAVDTYPVEGGIITDVGKNIRQAYAVSEGDQPVWHCGQLFSWPGQRMPTIREHRFMTWLALIEGAKGLLWYTYKGYGQYLPADSPELWEAHKKLLKEINALSPLFITNGKRKNIELAKRLNNIKGIFIVNQAGRFIFTANQSTTKSCDPVILLDNNYSGEIIVYGENRMIQAQNGRFSDHFHPLEVHIYKLTDEIRKQGVPK